ncbi:hypothetical protein [Embleya sp. NBC_00896]|uniref:phage baseplate protein n=1 Tax=Embleya sp. NBC_00896 TaxID=2975961 RepID=UPI0038681B5D|nr:hypothetical protein OG928_32370 [Embleya sp. NBC_00896]
MTERMALAGYQFVASVDPADEVDSIPGQESTESTEFAVVGGGWVDPGFSVLPPDPFDTAHVPGVVLQGAFAQGRRNVLQSFAFDNRAQQIYVMQVLPNNVRLSGESGPVPYAHRRAGGDLLCSRMDLNGRVLDFMYLRRFGHGTSFGVVPKAGGGVDLWLEGVPRGGDPTTSPARPPEATAVATTPYEPWSSTTNKAVDGDDASRVRLFHPLPGKTFVAPSIDPTTNRICLATRVGPAHSDRLYTYYLYDLDKARTGTWTPVARASFRHAYPQGLLSLGRYIYHWTGSPTADNAYLTTASWDTGEIVQRTFFPRVPADDQIREAEGLAAWLPGGDTARGVRLCFGFGTGRTGADRAITVKYVPDPTGTSLEARVLVDWQVVSPAAGVDTRAQPLRARLISLAGNRYLHMSGTVTLAEESVGLRHIGTLPAELRPSRLIVTNCPRNHRSGHSVCRVELRPDGGVYADGATRERPISWVQFDNVSTAWA